MVTPEQACELLKGTTPGPWEAGSYTYQLAGCPEATDFWVSSESSFIAENGNQVGRGSEAGNNFELIAAAPVMAETIAGMQAEYAVQYLAPSGEWKFTYEDYEIRWQSSLSVQMVRAVRDHTVEETRIVRRYVTDVEVMEEV